MRTGKFITFEGPDGSGKTTVGIYITEELKKLGYDVIYTREPGGIDIAEQIRDIILHPNNTAMDAKTEALLYAASRRQHIVEKIIPALRNNQIVISDRFVHSSLAYQGVGREIGIEDVYRINEFAIEGWFPDATIFLDVPPQVGLDRLANRESKDRLDQETIVFHQRVYEGYQQVLQQYRESMIVIDASQSLEVVKQQTLDIVLGMVSI